MAWPRWLTVKLWSTCFLIGFISKSASQETKFQMCSQRQKLETFFYDYLLRITIQLQKLSFPDASEATLSLLLFKPLPVGLCPAELSLLNWFYFTVTTLGTWAEGGVVSQTLCSTTSSGLLNFVFKLSLLGYLIWSVFLWLSDHLLRCNNSLSKKPSTGSNYMYMATSW